MRTAPIRSVPRTTGRARSAIAALALTSFLALPAAAHAALLPTGAAPAGLSARVTTGAPIATTVLPSTTGAAASVKAAKTGRWLIGVRGNRGAAAAVVRAAGGTFDATIGVASVPMGKADALAERLGADVHWAGPDVVATRLSSFDQPGIVTPWARSVANAPSLTPAPGSLAAIGVVDDSVDPSVAELQGAQVINDVGDVEGHGTMVASTAAAPYDGSGVVGVAPGAPVLSWGTDLSCGDVSSGIINLVKRGAKVVNLSLGFDDNCFALWDAASYAYAKGVPLVAAAGNDADKTNPLSYPASYPHVITAGAVDEALNSAVFSDYNQYVDIAAPGVDVPVDVPLRFDHSDGAVDGLSTVSGTSFSSPYVAGALSWILGARPTLDPGQAESVLRASARDLATPGWDPHTGYGLVQISQAMAVPTPEKDLLEPNDDPSFTKSSGKGTFGKPTVWSGGKAVRLVATGDSADDPVDAYRVKVPGHGRIKVTLKASEGLTDLYAFDQSVVSFGGKPLDHSTHGGIATDTIRLHNSGKSARVAFIVVNSVTPKGVTRTLSRYALTIKNG